MSYILNKKLLCSLAIAGTMINSTAFASENPFVLQYLKIIGHIQQWNI